MTLVKLIAFIVWTGVGICLIRTFMVYAEFVEPMKKMMRQSIKMHETICEDLNKNKIEG